MVNSENSVIKETNSIVWKAVGMVNKMFTFADQLGKKMIHWRRSNLRNFHTWLASFLVEADQVFSHPPLRRQYKNDDFKVYFHVNAFREALQARLMIRWWEVAIRRLPSEPYKAHQIHEKENVPSDARDQMYYTAMMHTLCQACALSKWSCSGHAVLEAGIFNKQVFLIIF